jgi:hypothetical protein
VYPASQLPVTGLSGDPVNVALLGTLQQLRTAFANAGWLEADRLGQISSWRRIRAFVFNKPYPIFPFSSRYLSDVVRTLVSRKRSITARASATMFASGPMSLAHAEDTLGRADFWRNTDRPPEGAHVLWVGAGTKERLLVIARGLV